MLERGGELRVARINSLFGARSDVLATFDRNVCRKFSASPGLAGEFESTKFLRPDTAEKTGGGELRSRSTTKFHLSLSDNLFSFFTRKFFTLPFFFLNLRDNVRKVWNGFRSL